MTHRYDFSSFPFAIGMDVYYGGPLGTITAINDDGTIVVDMRYGETVTAYPSEIAPRL